MIRLAPRGAEKGARHGKCVPVRRAHRRPGGAAAPLRARDAEVREASEAPGLTYAGADYAIMTDLPPWPRHADGYGEQMVAWVLDRVSASEPSGQPGRPAAPRVLSSSGN